MSNKEGKDTAFFLAKRTEASKKVIIQFVDVKFVKFNALDKEGTIKYFGKIDLEKSIDDDCTCLSFEHGMEYEKLGDEGKKGKSMYLEYGGTAFQCKHIIKAKSVRTSELTEIES